MHLGYVEMSKKPNHANPTFLTEIIQHQPLSVISYILYHHQNQRDKIEFDFSSNPFSYVYRFDNKYHLYGENIWQLSNKLRWFKDNIVLTFQDKTLWNEIINRFVNFRSLDTNKPVNTYDTYITYFLTQENFSSDNLSPNSILQIPSTVHPLPKRLRHLTEGLNFGLIKKGKIISFAAAPYIVTQEDFSFAILRGVETDFTERRKGYAQATTSKLCKELFTNYKIKQIFIWVEEDNQAAKKMYRKLGFQEESRVFTTYCDQKTDID